jgi:Protein of unknown function (DUF1700)
MTTDAQQRIEIYLAQLRAGLRGMNDADAREIVEELRSHIWDKANEGGEFTQARVDAALAALGDPEDLAKQYATDALLSRAEVSRSPVRILEILFRLASLSAAGLLVLVGSLFGYFFGVFLVLWAVLKIVHPRTAGLWVSRDGTGDLTASIGLGFGNVPLGARDVLDWWIVPLGLLVGVGLVILTTRFAAWCAGQFRKSLTKPSRG